MYHYNLITGESDDEAQQNFGDDTTNMSMIRESDYYECDSNERYNRHHNNPNESLPAFQPAYETASQGYNQPQNFMNQPEVGYGGANPAFEMIQQNPQMFPDAYKRINRIVSEPEYHDKTIHVPGFNPGGGEMLLPTNIEEICNKLQMEMDAEQEEAIEQRRKRFQGYFNNNYGYNYYGLPYTDYNDSSVTMKYRNKINKIKQEAIQKRTNFNKNITKLVHSYLQDGVTDEDIDNLYSGYEYTIPADKVRQESNMNKLSKMVPMDNANAYREHYRQLSNQYTSLVGENPNMNEFLNNLGLVQIQENLEKEYHRRKDLSQYYKTDTYRSILRRNIAKRKGTTENNIPLGSDFPTLNESAKLLDDGTLSISLPPWMKGQTSGADEVQHVQITNELEQNFEENRRRFLDSIYNLDSGGESK